MNKEMGMKYNVGDIVVCNGNNEARIIAKDYWETHNLYMYTIRLWDGFRHVGDVQMGEASLAQQQPDQNFKK
jgi:hypothetical protein